jgi:hypothetical protein
MYIIIFDNKSFLVKDYEIKDQLIKIYSYIEIKKQLIYTKEDIVCLKTIFNLFIFKEEEYHIPLRIRDITTYIHCL